MKFDEFTDVLLRAEAQANEITNQLFGDLDQEEILDDLFTGEDFVHIDTYAKLSCAIALSSIRDAIISAVSGRITDMMQSYGHAKTHLGRCSERLETQREISEDASERASKPRPDPLNTLIHEVLTDNPAMTEKEVLEALYEHERSGVIEEITEDEIYYIKGGKGGFTAPISGLKDRVSRIKKKMNSL